MGCALTLEPCGPVLLDRRPRARVTVPLACLLAVWQPVQKYHKDGKYSDMQVVEKMMAEGMGIPVLEFEFEEAEVSEMKPNFPTGALKFEEMKRDETAFKLRLEGFLFEHGMGSAEK